MKKMIHPILNKTTVVLTDGSSYTNVMISNKSKYYFLDQDNKSHSFWSITKNNTNVEVGGRRAKFQKRFNHTK